MWTIGGRAEFLGVVLAGTELTRENGRAVVGP
jgi:hypothetical protein